MTPDLSYYGHYALDDLFAGARQAVQAACAAFDRCDAEGMNEAIETYNKFSLAHSVTCERIAQKYLQ